MVLYAKAFLVRLGECFSALVAAVALKAVPVFTVTRSVDPAVVARHCAISLDRASQKPDNQIEGSVRLRSRGFQPRQGWQPKPGLLLHGYGGGGIKRSPPGLR